MKCAIALVVFVFLLAMPVAGLAQAIGHVRALDPAAAQALGHGLARSAVFRALAAELQESDVIVHIITTASLPEGVGGTTRLAGRSGTHRYVRIVLDPLLPVNQRTAILGHELQHAREIAASPASDAEGVRRLYQRIGQRVSGALDVFDTHAAASAGRRVWDDLRLFRRVPAPDAAGTALRAESSPRQ